MNKRFRPPIRLLIIAAALFVAGLVSIPLIKTYVPAKTLASSVLINGIPFLLVFIAILLTYIALIVTVSRYYSGYISETRFKPIFIAPIVGIVTGIVMMFQPWAMVLYQIGFLVVLFSLLSFIVISHITPRKDFEPTPAK
jgi:hypothetical protein